LCSLEVKNSERRTNMNKKLLTGVLATALFTMALLPAASMAGKGKMAGGGLGIKSGTKSTLQTRDRQRLKDGSCLTQGGSAAGEAQKKGNTYGPGDGTGNDGLGPKDGDGYGAPDNR
jgi:hypothetical protein